jgi:hypothetical protein
MCVAAQKHGAYAEQWGQRSGDDKCLKLFDKALIDLVWPDNENVGDPIVDNPGNWNFTPVKIDSAYHWLCPMN